MPYLSEDDQARQLRALPHAELVELLLNETLDKASRFGTVKTRRLAAVADSRAGTDTMRAIGKLLDLVEECGIEEVRRAIAESRGDH